MRKKELGDSVNLGDMEEWEFKEKLMNDLEKRGVNAVDLGERGTFDLIIEGQRPYLVELKKVTPELLDLTIKDVTGSAQNG